MSGLVLVRYWRHSMPCLNIVGFFSCSPVVVKFLPITIGVGQIEALSKLNFFNSLMIIPCLLKLYTFLCHLCAFLFPKSSSLAQGPLEQRPN